MRIPLMLALLASPAAADDVHRWGYLAGYESTITLQPTIAPGAVAEVMFVNKTVHADEDVEFALTMGDMTVQVLAQVGRGMTPDRMTVVPPDGYIAIPPELDVKEDESGRIVIMPWVGF